MHVLNFFLASATTLSAAAERMGGCEEGGGVGELRAFAASTTSAASLCDIFNAGEF